MLLTIKGNFWKMFFLSCSTLMLLGLQQNGSLHKIWCVLFINQLAISLHQGERGYCMIQHHRQPDPAASLGAHAAAQIIVQTATGADHRAASWMKPVQISKSGESPCVFEAVLTAHGEPGLVIFCKRMVHRSGSGSPFSKRVFLMLRFISFIYIALKNELLWKKIPKLTLSHLNLLCESSQKIHTLRKSLS